VKENEHLIDVTKRAKSLEIIYPGKVGIIHGKMNNVDKDRIMQAFKDGDINILVATSVIEVGIDVKDATLIVIENAEKFGLSSLHQLRGRVGRSSLQSHAILLFAHTRFSNIAKERLKIMRESEDGFYIAEQDLILRGGGEILGTKQSGEHNFIFADIAKDIEILVESNKKAAEYIQNKTIQKYPLFLKIFQKDPNSENILE
jgi:ATP-dependent DNA helicase RecG